MSIRQGRPEDYSKGPYLIVLDVAPCSLTFALQSPPPRELPFHIVVPASLRVPLPPRFSTIVIVGRAWPRSRKRSTTKHYHVAGINSTLCFELDRLRRNLSTMFAYTMYTVLAYLLYLRITTLLVTKSSCSLNILRVFSSIRLRRS